MTSKTIQAENRRVAPLARIVAFLLLVLVTYTATVEVMHQHGNLLPASSTVAATLSDAQNDNSSTNSSSSTGECLICQLHQNLFSSLLFSVPGIEPPQAEEIQASQTFFFTPTEASAPRRGRAPPQAFLL